MIPLNPWENQNAIKTLYSRCIEQVCEKHCVTRMELDILLFLANNPCFDTATDIVEVRFLAKSQVSVSIKLLKEKGYIKKQYAEGNRKTAHLRICGNAREMIADGREAQEKFLAILLEGIPEQEMACMKRCTSHMMKNIERYLKEEEENV